MRSINTYILEKLRVTTKGHISKMSLEEFAKRRNSLNEYENDLKLNSEHVTKGVFINWVENMLIDDEVIETIPYVKYMNHILRFDGDILIDNIADDEVDPPVSTEMYLTWGEAYMRIVTYYVKNNIFDNCNVHE